jgi:CheY-like chemotaxis protein
MDKKNILLVEDDMGIRESMRQVLEMQGYIVITASNGKEGLDCLATLEAKPHLVILDLMMPEYNGWQFVDHARTHPHLKDVPVVICSAYPETAKTFKPAAIIEKPVEFNKLLETVKSVCK